MKKLLHIIKWWAEVLLFVLDGFLIFLLGLGIYMGLTPPAQAEVITYPVAYVDVNAGSSLNVRKAPGGDLTGIRLYCREDVVILAEVDGWALVIRPQNVGKTAMDGQPLGWASMDYLRCYRKHLSIAKEPASATADPNALTTDYPSIIADTEE